MTRRAFLLLLAMSIFAIIYNIYLPAHPDETYYWQWGRHLALSYYDGPPLMAYLIRIVTTIFGISAWSIKFTAVICMTGGIYFIYRLSRELFDSKTAFFTLLLIIFLPITQAGYTVSTLDPALFLFWSLTLYWFYLAITRDDDKYRYLAGIALGLTLLAKYPGVLLGVSLFLFLIFSSYRKQLKNIHWYIAALIAIIVFSPVIIWNWQHHWASFDYQFTHGVSQHLRFNFDLMLNYLAGQLGIANPIFLIAAIYFSLRHLKTICNDRRLLFVALPFWLVFLFFFYNGSFKFAESNWAAPAYISATILVAHFIVHFQRRILLYSITILGIALCIFIRFPITTPFLPKQAILLGKFLGYKQVIAQASTAYQKSDVIVSGNIQNASELALYLPGHPQTYILRETHRQYAIWSAPIKTAIRAGKIKAIVYIGEPGNTDQLDQYFKHQKLIKQLNYQGQWNTRHWVMIRAWND